MLARADGDTLVQYAAHPTSSTAGSEPERGRGRWGGRGCNSIPITLVGAALPTTFFQVSESSVWRAAGNLEDTANSFDALFIGTDMTWWRKHGGFLMVIGSGQVSTRWFDADENMWMILENKLVHQYR